MKNRCWKILWLLQFYSYLVFPVSLCAGDGRDLDEEDLYIPRPEKRYESLVEERFQMECDYLGIKGHRKKKARQLFEISQQKRELVEKNKVSGKQQVTRAIGKLNRIDIEYYERLAPLVSGRKNRTRLERILDTLRKRNDRQVNMKKPVETRSPTACVSSMG